MPDSTNLTTKITDASNKPKSISGDAGSVQAQPLPDLIAADLHLARKAASAKGLGIKFHKTRMWGVC